MADYQNLIADIIGFLDRADLSSRADDFLVSAHNAIGRRMRVTAALRMNENFQINSDYLTPPSMMGGNFLGIKHWFIPGAAPVGGSWYSASPTTELKLLSHTELVRRYGDEIGPPRHYAIVGHNSFDSPNIPTASVQAPRLLIGPNPGVTVYRSVMEWWEGPPPHLWSPTWYYSWASGKYYDAYLYAALLAAEAWLKDDPRIEFWKQAYDNIWREIEEESAQAAGGHGNDIVPDMVLMNERN